MSPKHKKQEENYAKAILIELPKTSDRELFKALGWGGQAE